MTEDLQPISSNEPDEERIKKLLSRFRDIEPPPRPNDETMIKRLSEMPLHRWSRTIFFIERIRNMPMAIRLGMASCVIVAVMLFGAQWGAGNPAFGDIEKTIGEQRAVRVQVDTDVQMPNAQQKGKRILYASMKPLILRTETDDGSIEILDVSGGKRLLIQPQKKVAILHVMPKPGAAAPKSLLEALQLHFHDNAQGEGKAEQLDGLEVLVYRTEQATVTNKSRIKETMWVNHKTNLPVKTQGEIVSTDPKMSQFFSRVVMSDFRWNPPEASKTDFFSTEPPVGFELQTIDTRSTEPKQPADSAIPPIKK